MVSLTPHRDAALRMIEERHRLNESVPPEEREIRRLCSAIADAATLRVADGQDRDEPYTEAFDDIVHAFMETILSLTASAVCAGPEEAETAHTKPEAKALACEFTNHITFAIAQEIMSGHGPIHTVAGFTVEPHKPGHA